MPDEQELIDTLQIKADELGRPPTPREVTSSGPYDASIYLSIFNDWDEALSAAGLLAKDGRRETTREHLLADLRLLADQSDTELTEETLRQHSSYSVDEFVSVFGSVQNALAHVQHDMASEKPRRLIEELQRLDDELQHAPTPAEMRRYGEFSPSAYRESFGDWRTAVRQALGKEV